MSKEELYNIVFDTPELKEYVENKDKEIEILKNMKEELEEYIEGIDDRNSIKIQHIKSDMQKILRRRR